MEPSQTAPFRARLLIWIIAAAVISALSIAASYGYYYNSTVKDITSYLDTIHATERGYIENLPLYDDYATPQRELKLRTYLFPAHMDVAARSGMKPIAIDDSLSDLVKGGSLVKVKSGTEKLYYFYNVREKYRVLTPVAACGLKAITDRFQQNIATRLKLPPVKIALSSMLRPASYQTDLRTINANATEITSHSYGISFDIFYDDYFVSLPRPVASNAISDVVMDMLRTRMGFLLGDALRGQFRAMLMETLVQLQEEGMLYAIWERNQRCYHVTILPNPRCEKKGGH
ncbi:MAG: hypothetical protein KA369_07815 [Spirochaetes bacterium]|nr:hypothetical protein [Spirochaetota bacterium]